MAPQLPASALAAISGYIDREEPAEPPAPARPAPAAPAAAPPQLPASALAAISGYIDREEPAAPPLPPPAPAAPPPARDREEQTLREIEPLDASAVFALLHPDGPGYAVVDGVLGEAAARRAARAAAAARTQLTRARVGRGDARRLSDERTDEAAFLDERSQHPDLQKLCKALRKLRSSLCRGGAWDDKAAELRLDATTTSTQLACYQPGGRYRRHADALSDDDARQRDALRGKPLLTRNRRITAVYYLNEAWNREDGGALRIYADTWTPDARPFDVLPRLDRLVLFRSTLAHEVLVTRKERLALTQWWYGRIDADNERVPWRLPAPGRALSGTSTEGRILVSVAAYRDPETERTLQHLFATAKDPKRIRVVVVQQYDCLEGTDDDLVGRLYNQEAEARITRIRVDFRDANGPCPARACALRRLTDEDDFVLQIDSHTRFRSHWDAYLIDQLAKCGSEEPVLTAYPADYDKDAAALPSDVRPTLLVPSGFDKDGVLRIKGRRLARVHDKPVPSPLWCAGFSFCRAQVWRRVTYEPLPHLFFGEELLHAARLYVAGCDFFAPPEQVIFHRWSRSGRRTLAEDQPRRNVAAARGRAFELLETIEGPRSLAAFEARAGIDLQRRVLLPGADRGGLSPEAFADGAPSAAGAQVAALLGLKL